MSDPVQIPKSNERVVAVSGSSGLIGTALIKALPDHGYRVARLVRRPVQGADEIFWDPANNSIDQASLEGCYGVVHLAGVGIGDRRWNSEHLKAVRDSRTAGTRLLASAVAACDRPPTAFLSGSAIGYYGHRPAEVLDEQSKPGETVLSDIVTQWEASTLPATAAGVSTTFLRTGIVLDTAGGALAKMLPLFRFGLGGRFGAGDQVMSWISMADEVAAILALLDRPVPGPVNLTAPNPVSNRDFTAALAAALHRPAFLPVPAFGPRLLLGRQMADALLFDSADVRPRVLLSNGFEFRHPTIDVALKEVLG